MFKNIFLFFIFVISYASENEKSNNSYYFNKFIYVSVNYPRGFGNDYNLKRMEIFHSDTVISDVFSSSSSKIYLTEFSEIAAERYCAKNYKTAFSFFKDFFPSEKFFYATFYEFAFFEPLELFSSEYYSSHCVDLGQFQNISGSESEYDELKRYQGSIRKHFFDHKNKWQGNCQGLAFYCYLNSLIYKKYFKAPYVFAIGSILPSGEVRGVGHCYGKIILSLLFVLSNIVNKVFFDKDFLFILPRFYKMFFDKLFVFIEDKYNIKINRLYLYNIKDIDDKENNNLFTEGYKMDFKLNENSYGYKDFSVNSLEDSLESLIPKKNDNFKQEIFDIYSHAIDVFQEVSGVKRKKSTFFSSGWNSLLSIIGLKNENETNETADFNFRYIWYDLIESIRSTHFLKKEQKIELVCNSFDKESIENLCSFFESGNHKIEFFYGKGE